MSDTLEREKNDSLDDSLNPANRKPSVETQLGTTDMSEFENEFNTQPPIVGNDLRGREEAFTGASVATGDLKDIEESASVENPINFTGGNSQTKITVEKNGWWNRKRAKVAGGVAGIGVMGGVLGLTALSGPLEFIHLASILHDSHFSQQEDAGDGRMGKMYRYFRGGFDAGETRLTWIQSKYKSRILGQLKEVGLTPVFDKTTGYYKSMDIQTKGEKSPYSGLSNEEAKAAIQRDYGGKVYQYADGKFRIQQVGDGYSIQKDALKTTVKATGNSKISTAARVRILKKYGMVTWHPLKKIDKKINAKASDIAKGYKEKWDNRIKKGVDPVEAADKGAKNDDGKDAKGNPKTTDSTAEQKSAIGEGSKGVSEKLSGLKTTGKIAGGVAAAAGIACAAKAVDDSIGDIKYAQVILPMVRVGLNAIAVGEQIKSGQDVDPDELAYLSKYFSSTDSKTGTSTSWTDSQSIQAETGGSGGVDMSQGIKDTIQQGKPEWLAWTQNDIISGLCSTTGTIITGIIGGVVGVLSGGVLSTVSGFVISSLATGPIIDFISGLLSGDALNVDSLAGAAYGNVADYGAAMGANAASLAMGGAKLSDAAISENNSLSKQGNKIAFDSQNVFKRVFDVNDYQSVASIALTSQSTSFTKNLASMSTSLFTTFGNALSLPTKLYASTVHAAPSTYRYPFDTYGFSQAELSNTAVDNPYDNADQVAKILNSNDANGVPDYIGKAADCFGVEISKANSDGVWDVKPNKDINVYDTDNYHPDDCVDSSDSNWLKVRFFVLDTGVMEGMACADFQDSTSCSNNGESNASDTASNDTASGVSGSSKELAQKLLDQVGAGRVTMTDSVTSDLKKTVQGQELYIGDSSQGGGKCSNPKATDINATLLQLLLNISAKYKIQIQNIVSGHPCDTMNHSTGHASDIYAIDGRSLDDNWWASKDALPITTDIGNIEQATDPSNKFGLGVGCSAYGKFKAPSNVLIFGDSGNIGPDQAACTGPPSGQDEIHVDVRG